MVSVSVCVADKGMISVSRTTTSYELLSAVITKTKITTSYASPHDINLSTSTITMKTMSYEFYADEMSSVVYHGISSGVANETYYAGIDTFPSDNMVKTTLYESNTNERTPVVTTSSTVTMETYSSSSYQSLNKGPSYLSYDKGKSDTYCRSLYNNDNNGGRNIEATSAAVNIL